MKKIASIISASLLALAAIVTIWFLLNNLQPLSPGLYSFAVIFIIGTIILFRLFTPVFSRSIFYFLKKIIQLKKFTVVAVIIITLIAILARLYFYFHFSYAPVSDPVTFYESAKNIANGSGLQGNTYPAFFPYLAAYDNILGAAMKVIQNPWLATIVLNTVFDIAAGFAAYLVVKKLTKPASKLPIVALAVWLLNPFGILFSVLSLPIVIVNFFIITMVLITYILIEKIQARKLVPSLITAIVLGLVIGLGNCFRPIFVVAIIALFLISVYILITKKDKKILLPMASSFVVIIILFFGIQKLDLALVAKETNLIPASNSSGWSIYVGSNSATNGTWNIEDQNRISQICTTKNDFTDCHQKLEKAGIERYKEQGFVGTINLFIRKLYIFTNDQSTTYNANYSLVNYSSSTTQKAMGIYITFFILALFALSSLFLLQTAKIVNSTNNLSPIILFIALLILGFFLSDMLVETAPRYAQILYPLFIVLSVLSLGMVKYGKHAKISNHK